MASVEIVDETVAVVDRVAFATIVSDQRRWTTWWPGCQVTVVHDRGVDGMQWTVSGELVGFTEVRLLARPDAIVIHYRLSADPTVPGSRTERRTVTGSPRGQRELSEIRRRQLMSWKTTVWDMLDALGAARVSE